MRPAVPLQEDQRALVARQRAAVGCRAVVGHLHLAPARPVLRQSEVVREVGGVGHRERVGRKQLRGPVDTPPLVAVKVQSRLSQSSGPVEAAAIVSARRGRCAGGSQGARGHVPDRGEVPRVGVVDDEGAAGYPGGRAQQAHAGDGAGGRQRGSGDGAGGRDRCAGDCARPLRPS